MTYKNWLNRQLIMAFTIFIIVAILGVLLGFLLGMETLLQWILCIILTIIACYIVTYIILALYFYIYFKRHEEEIWQSFEDKIKNIFQCELSENVGFNLDKAMRFVEFQSPDVVYLEYSYCILDYFHH